MHLKPPRWNISPALVAPEARALWKDVAFVAPLWGVSGKGVLIGAHGQPINLLPTQNSPKWYGTPYGFGLSRVPGTSDPRILRFARNLITTSDGAGTGDFTVATIADPVSEAVVRFNLSQRTASGSGPRFFTGANHNGSAVAAGYFLFGTRDAAGVTDVAVANAVDGRDHLFVCRRKGTTNDVFRDGVGVGSTTGTIRTITQASNEFAFGGLGGDTVDGMNDSTRIVFAAAWNRALSSAEMRMLARDPFCMFRPAPEWRGVWTALAGGDVVLQPSDILDVLSFASPTFSQAHVFSGSEWYLAENLETPTFGYESLLSPAKLTLVEGFESVGLSQSHLFPVDELRSLLAFDAALLMTGGGVAPGFRSRTLGVDARQTGISNSVRSLAASPDDRSRSIKE